VAGYTESNACVAYGRESIPIEWANLIPDDLAGVCGDIAILTGAWESNIALKLMSYEEALAADPIIIIIHLLGLAPAGYLAAPDNGA
jgi:hypothetical protein